MTMNTRSYFLNPGAACLLLLSSAVGCSSSSSPRSDASTGTDTHAGTGGRAGTGGSAGTGGRAGTGGGAGNAGTDARDATGQDGTDARDAAGDTAANRLPVSLGMAGGYVILAKSGIDTVPTSAVTGNLGISPAAATAITGFPLTADSTNVFSRSPQVTGQIYASDYAPPTPDNLTTAIGDLQLAINDAAGRAAGVTELGAGSIGGRTITPGVYKWGTGVLIATSITLSGDANAVWIFQIAQSLMISSGAMVTLSGGALPKNIFWQVEGLVDLATTAHIEGIVLSHTSITLGTGASARGRLLAQTAVNIAGSTVVQPAP